VKVENSVTKKIEEKLKTFNRLSFILQILFTFFALSSVCLSLAVATFSSEMEKEGKLKYFAYAAALSSSIISAFSLDRKSSDARTAWRLLNVALMRRTSNPKALSEDELIRFYAEAEDTLGHIVFNPPQQESRIIKTENEELKQKITDLEKRIHELGNNESNQTEASVNSEEATENGGI
jgi:hypothetical protein